MLCFVFCSVQSTFCFPFDSPPALFCFFKGRQTRVTWRAWEGTEFGGRENREDVLDGVKVRDPEGLSEDSGSRNGEKEKNLTSVQR